MSKRALVIVDLQNDFCPGGSLPVMEGDQIVPVVNRLIKKFLHAGLPVYATRDWHPPDHCSFQEQGGLWPPHCVRDTQGARFHPNLQLPNDVTIVSKGRTPDRDAYSGFDGTDLARRLRQDEVGGLIICGLATDYCVKATALDGLKEGFAITIVEDGIRGVNVKPDDSYEAIAKMKKAGAQVVLERWVAV